MNHDTCSKSLIGSAPTVWDKVAATYDEMRMSDPVYSSCIQQTVSAVFKVRKSALCLDAGCGTGMSSIELSKHHDLVIAVDFSMESLLVLKRKRPKDDVILVQADITHLPFKNDSFEGTICANTLQHLRPGKPQKGAIMELTRVTKYNGKLAVSVHHYSKEKQRAGWIKEGKPGQADIDYIYRFSRQDLAAIMPKAGIKGIGFYGLRIPYFGARLQNIFAMLVGRFAAHLGYGHMLLAVQKINGNSRAKCSSEL